MLIAKGLNMTVVTALKEVYDPVLPPTIPDISIENVVKL